MLGRGTRLGICGALFLEAQLGRGLEGHKAGIVYYRNWIEAAIR